LNENQILVLAKLHNEIIGGSLFMKFGTFVHYHLSAKLSDFSRLPLTNLILDYSINYSKKMGYNYFYMGGATTNNQDDSLLKFKKSFSKDYKYFYIGKKIHNKTIYNEVIKQWTNRYPEKVEKFKNFLLKYRY
jgi:lipid II:glycine glycyltransferase (peptidoglycan interpeptide bridge formation enzyme)